MLETYEMSVPVIPPGLHWSEIDVYCAYFDLNTNEQRVCEKLLLSLALCDGGMNIFAKKTKAADELRHDCFRKLLDGTSNQFAWVWRTWTLEMLDCNHPANHLQHSLLAFLGVLIRGRLAKSSAAKRSTRTAFWIDSNDPLPVLYRALPEHQREVMDDFFLEHLFATRGLDVYGPPGAWNSFVRDSTLEKLELLLGRSAARTWKKWASAVVKCSNSPAACHAEVLAMFKLFLVVRASEEFLPNVTTNENAAWNVDVG